MLYVTDKKKNLNQNKNQFRPYHRHSALPPICIKMTPEFSETYRPTEQFTIADYNLFIKKPGFPPSIME